MKIDCHMHLKGDRPHWGWDDDDLIIDAADRLEIDQLCCSIPITRGIPTMDEIRAVNNSVLAAMRRYPDRLLGYCHVCPGHAESVDEVDRCLDQGMIGVKLYNQYKVWDPAVFPVIEKTIRERVPILHHAAYLTTEEFQAGQPNASHGGDFARVAALYPEATIIEAHIGGGGDWEWGIKQLRGAPSIYLDTAGSVIDEGMVEMAVRELGADRVVFGTDMVMEGGVGKVLDANLTASQREHIFWRNMKGILNQRR